MKFQELIKLMEDQFEIDVQADIARELDVTPQTLNNWKIRDRIPYKYVKKINKKISKKNTIGIGNVEGGAYYGQPIISDNDNDIDVVRYLLKVIVEIKKYYILFVSIIIVFLLYALINHKYFSDPRYVSTATIAPSQNSDNLSSSLSSVTQSFGLNVPGSNLSLSDPQMIIELLLSKGLALKILNKSFNSKKHGNDKKLINILSFDKDLSNQKLTRDDTTNLVIRFTKKNIGLVKTKNPGIVRFKTFFYEPEIAAQIALVTINELDAFYRQNKKSKNSSKKIFINERSAQVFKQLTVDENNLKEFREKNRTIISSPELMLEQTRLLRNVEVQSQLYITLLSQYELVSIDESEDVSFVEIIDPPFVPTFRIAPILTNSILKYLLFGIIVGLISIYVNNGEIKKIVIKTYNKYSSDLS